MNISRNINKNSPIAFFDSGLGGLTVLKQLKKLLPCENYVYFGDTAHVPYGTKTKEELLAYSGKILQFLEEKNCKALVMACNTTSSMIYEDIKDGYNFKIYPIIQSVAKIIAEANVGSIGLFATKGTVNSGVYPAEIHKYNSKMKVYSQFCPDWVDIVEGNKFNDENSIEIIKNDLSVMMQNEPEKIVLGCTHYPFLLEILARFASFDIFIDPAIYFAQYIKSDLEKRGLLSDTKDFQTEYFVSANVESFNKSVKRMFDIDIKAELVNF